ncbi:MAG: hypothetical protein M0R02_14260, partial [Bacteroidales bacterium]|nr:hypothetical protein [Bacteroidales bacterium]
MGKQNILPTIASGVVSAALAVPLWAQTAPLQQPDNRQSARIDEIIVTAQRRAESLQNVPVSVQAFTGDSLSERGISNITELGRLAPSLTVQNTSSLVSP